MNWSGSVGRVEWFGSSEVERMMENVFFYLSWDGRYLDWSWFWVLVFEVVFVLFFRLDE